jgi:hypothetical protein
MNQENFDTEDKLAWCEKFGTENELNFAISKMHDVGLPTYVNPAKKTDKYTHDLFTIFPSDLKTVKTPLFKAKELFDIDPQFAVTFNLKDGLRYTKLYPNIIVIFDVEWKDQCSMIIGGNKYEVQPMHQIHVGFLKDIKNAIIKNGNKKITYSKRVNDNKGNAKESFVFDVRNLQRLK